MADEDLLTLAEAKTVLSEDGSTHDTELAAVITAVSKRIDQLCGPVVRRTVTDELHDGGCSWVKLGYAYGVSASSVTEYRQTTATVLSAETNDTKTATDYLLDDIGGGVTLLRRRVSGSDGMFPVGRRNVKVTYTAGRYADTASVDELFKRAAGFLVTHLWKTTAPAWFTNQEFFDDAAPAPAVPSFGMPNVVKDMLADELRAPVVF